MLFNSIQFLFFFITVTALYFVVPDKIRWFLLLLASCWFYMAFVPVYILILLFTIIVDYSAGILIERAENRGKKIYLIASILANVGVLALFKYYNFFSSNINTIFNFSNINYSLPIYALVLPIGLSFHTFQAMSYTIEVFRGNQKAEKHFGIYALYVMYYPQLVAGPIERPQHILPQLRKRYEWDSERFKNGILQMLWGLFKKVVIADRLALFVDFVYKDPSHQPSLNIVVAIVFYSFQIYCDFSGYSSMAIGISRIMGIDLTENFRTPYFSKSMIEFWTRWHISLSSWFRDYLYIPLGGNKVSEVRLYFNLFIVFLISGLWHGASWGFVIWGLLHGILIIINNIKRKYFSWAIKVPDIINILFVFTLVSFAWIFFRSPSLDIAMTIFRQIKEGGWHLSGFNSNEVVYCFILIIFLLIKEYFDSKTVFVGIKHFYFKATLGAFAIYLLGIFSENQFIYFQF